MKQFTQNALKFFFSALLLATAIGKLLDNRGFAEVISSYNLIPNEYTLVMGLAVSLIELYLALYIGLAKNLRKASVWLIVIHLGYVALAASTLARGLELSNCGCFGVFWARPLTLMTVVEDLGLVLLSALLFWATKKDDKFNRFF